MKRSKKNKDQPEQGRRRPTEGPSRERFTYYSGSRTAMSQRSQESRNTANSNAKEQLMSSGTGTTLSQLATRVKKQWGMVVVGIVLLICVISSLQIDTKPRIVILGDAGKYNLHTSNDYAAQVTDSLRHSLLNGNKVTINTAAIVRDLMAAFPEIHDASVVLPLVSHRPTVYVELAKPVMVLQTANGAYVIDSSGRALQASSDHTKFAALGLPAVVDQNNLKLQINDIVFSSSSVAFVHDVIRQFKAQNTTINRLVLPAGKEELDVYPAGVSYFVKFNLHATNSRQQVGTYFAAYEELTRKGKGKKKLPSEYFDVRLPGRVYYK